MGIAAQHTLAAPNAQGGGSIGKNVAKSMLLVAVHHHFFQAANTQEVPISVSSADCLLSLC
jgi:hypothetical protein